MPFDIFDDSDADWDWTDDLSVADDLDDNDYQSTTKPSSNNAAVTTDRMNSNSDHNSNRCLIIESLPPQLHPAVSLGMHRVQSCYFSVGSSERERSMTDLLSLLGGAGAGAGNDATVGGKANTGSASLLNQSAASFDDDASMITADNTFSADETLPSSATERNNCGKCSDEKMASSSSNGTCTLLYHDIMMNILTFLDATSLASFSETARQPNFECFYFLQLQLQRALLHSEHHYCTHGGHQQEEQKQEQNQQSLLLNRNQQQAQDYHQNQQQQPDQQYNPDHQDQLSTIAGSACISRLASLSQRDAKETVQEYLDSNSTLRVMPLSHSLAYLRHLLRSNVFFSNNNNKSHDNSSNGEHNNNHNLAKAAVLVGVVGAASILTGNAEPAAEAAHAAAEAFASHVPDMSELSYMLVRLGFVGSLMSAAQQRLQNDTKNSDDGDDDRNHNQHHQDHVIEAGETMITRMQEMPSSTTMSSSLRRMYQAFSTMQNANSSRSSTNGDGRGNDDDDAAEDIVTLPLTPDPYEHIQETTTTTDESPASPSRSQKGRSVSFFSLPPLPEKRILQKSKQQKANAVKKMPSGCVGAYFRAVNGASNKIIQIIKERRKQNYKNLQESQQQIATEFIDACCSDDNLHTVKDLVEQVDVDGFYVGSDGTETCALHAAAFHGAYQVLEFLCCDIHESDPTKDGGLCNVNIKDTNGWTALHFAAGADCVQSVRILQHHGALLAEEAANGYTPYQWAQRLQHKEVAEEILNLINEDKNNNNGNTDHGFFLRRRQPAVRETWTSQRFSAIQHFFSLIPTH